MRKLLFFALAVLLVVSASDGYAWNIRQNDDNTTDWVRQDPVGAEDAAQVGRAFASGFMYGVATAQTTAISVPITAAKVLRIQVAMVGSYTGSTAFSFYRSRDSSGTVLTVDDSTTGAAAVLTGEITNSTSRLTLTGNSLSGGSGTFTPAGNHFVSRGDAILIFSDGGSTDTNNVGVFRAGANFVITFVPR